MRYTVSIKKNRDFRRLYRSGKSSANAYLAVYLRRNKLDSNRLGITTGVKLGNAVTRNRVRRLIREAYRLCEDRLIKGYDIVIVARTRAAGASFKDIDESLRALMKKLGAAEENL